MSIFLRHTFLSNVTTHRDTPSTKFFFSSTVLPSISLGTLNTENSHKDFTLIMYHVVM